MKVTIGLNWRTILRGIGKFVKWTFNIGDRWMKRIYNLLRICFLHGLVQTDTGNSIQAIVCAQFGRTVSCHKNRPMVVHLTTPPLTTVCCKWVSNE
jgi:hypothetical protein